MYIKYNNKSKKKIMAPTGNGKTEKDKFSAIEAQLVT